MRKIISFVLALVMAAGIFVSTPLVSSAAVIVSGTMQDTSANNNGVVHWQLTYSAFSQFASLRLYGNGYMPSGMDDTSWKAALEGRYLSDVTIEYGVKSIMDDAFYGEVYLKNINLPNSIERIGHYAFAGTSISYVKLPRKLVYFDNMMFDSTQIKNYAVDSSNENYSAVDGVLYSKDKSVLVAFPCGRFVEGFDSDGNPVPDNDYTFEIPSYVKEIGEYAFYNSYASSVVIPGNVKTVGKQAFAGNVNLKNLVIENGVKSFGESAFLSCSSLVDITFPYSVNYIGYNSFGFQYDVALEGVAEVLDEQGIEHEPITLSNAAYYAELAGYEISSFIYCYPSGDTTISAPKGSAAENYALRFRMNFKPVSAIAKSAAVKSQGVSVAWCQESQCDGYEIYRQVNNGKWNLIGSVEDNAVTEYFDEGAVTNAKNTYRIVPVNYTADGVYDMQGTGVYYIKAPKPLSVSNNVGGVKFIWESQSVADGYYVYRKTDNGSWKKIATVNGDTDYYKDTKVSDGKKYTYSVKAFDSKGVSSYDSAGKSIYFVSSPEVTIVGNSSKGVKIRWTKTSGAVNYVIYRKDSSGWKKLKTVSAKSREFIDESAVSGVKYRYSVRAVTENGKSSYRTDVDRIEFLSTPKLKSAKSTKSGIKLVYSKSNGAKTYKIYRKTSKSGDWKTLATVKAATTYVDKSAKKGKTYYYTVRAYDGSYKSSYSSTGIKIKDNY